MSYTVPVLAFRERKMRQNEKAFILALIFIIEQTVRNVPWNTLLKGKVPVDPTIFLWEILSRTSKCPRTPLFLLCLSENIAPDHIIFG